MTGRWPRTRRTNSMTVSILPSLYLIAHRFYSRGEGYNSEISDSQQIGGNSNPSPGLKTFLRSRYSGLLAMGHAKSLSPDVYCKYS